nr:reverse transcriptase domain-containing protein [Tanacetum cinerariifolium]
MLRDIGETFRTLRKINMKLNPKKCTFGAVKGMFLGYTINPEGIKPCLDKTEAVPQLPSPQTIKEVQSLNGKLASLNRFLSKTITKIERHAGRTQYHISAKDVGERTGPSGFPYRNAGRKSARRISSRNSTRAVDTLHGWIFAASNNEAEYEALIAGLRIAAQMGVQNVHVSVDYKLVANQVLGAYVAKEENMIKYTEKVKSMVSGFTKFFINQVPRSKNKKAYALSKIASTSFAHLSKQVLVEILKEKSIQEKEEGGKKALYQGPTVQIIGRSSLQAVIPYAVVKVRQTTPSRRLSNTSYRDKKPPAASNPDHGFVAVLQAHRTMIKSSHGDTPFSLTYGTEAVIPAEIGMSIYHTATVDVVHNDEELQLNLDFLEGQRERTAIREAKAKLKMTKYYNARVCGVTFKPEIGMSTYRTAAVDVVHNDEELWLNLDLLEEQCECTVIREAKAKSKMTKYYNARVHGVTFRLGDFVYRSNDASHAVDGGKLGLK